MVRVRRGELADAEQVAEVHRLSRAHYYGVPPAARDDRAAMWLSLIGDPDRRTVVADDDGLVIGVMSARPVPHDPSALELTALYVSPARFGQGLGARLHRTFDEGRRPHESGVLEVWAGNHHAIGFYERRGWTATEATRPGPGDLPFVTYRLPPTGTA